MLFFDIDGTLLDHKRAERRAAAALQQRHAGIFPEAPDIFTRRWHEASERHLRRHYAGELSFQGQRRARVKDLFAHARELSDDEADDIFRVYLQLYEENWSLFPDAGECLSRLGNEPLGIISNGDSMQQRRKLQAVGILERFAVVVVSNDLGISKPKRDIFDAACRTAGRRPEECIYVGDDLEADVRGSVNAGWRCIWLNRDGSQKSVAVSEISSLQQLVRTADGYTVHP